MDLSYHTFHRGLFKFFLGVLPNPIRHKWPSSLRIALSLLVLTQLCQKSLWRISLKNPFLPSRVTRTSSSPRACLRSPENAKKNAGPAGYWWMCRYSKLIWMLRLLINSAWSNATQWLICIQMKYNVSHKTLFISVQSIHFFRLLNWEGIQLSYINNLQSSDIPKEFEARAHFCYTEIVFHFALMWFVSPGSDFPIMYQRLDSRNGLLKEGKRIYLTWIKIGSSSRVKLWITF